MGKVKTTSDNKVKLIPCDFKGCNKNFATKDSFKLINWGTREIRACEVGLQLIFDLLICIINNLATYYGWWRGGLKLNGYVW